MNEQTTDVRGYTLVAQITCVRRELAMRKNVAIYDTLSALVAELD